MGIARVGALAPDVDGESVRRGHDGAGLDAQRTRFKAGVRVATVKLLHVPQNFLPGGHLAAGGRLLRGLEHDLHRSRQFLFPFL